MEPKNLRVGQNLIKTKMKKMSFKQTTCILSIIFALGSINLSSAQEEVRPIRIGLKFGTPMLGGLNLEYVTPVFNNHLSADLDVSNFSGLISTDTEKVGYSYFGIGANYYFSKPGSGLYGGIGYGHMGFTAHETLSTISNGTLITANAEGSMAYNVMNMKIGGKHGKQFYFRWELGYGLTLNGGDLLVSANTSTSGGSTVHLEETVSIPLKGLPIANIGVGFAF